MKLPGQLEAQYALKGLWLAAIGVVVLGAIAVAAVQTMRIEGFKVWFIEREGLKPKAERLEGEIRTIRVVEVEAAKKAQAAKEKTEKTYSTIAKRIDDHATAELPRQLAAADRYIAAHRVRAPALGCPTGATAAAPGDHRAADLAGAGRTAQLDDPGVAPAQSVSSALVAVSAADVRICTVNTIKAEAGHALATGLAAASAPPASK